MLDERRVLVVQDQFFERVVQVVGLCETEARGRLVDDAVLDLTFHTAGEQRETDEALQLMHHTPSINTVLTRH